MRLLRRQNNGNGFTLIEMLLSIAIMAMLLTSIGIAVQASFMSYEENTEIASASQAARSILDRMMRDVRTAASIDPASTSTRLIIIPPAGSPTTRIEYLYSGNTLYYNTIIGGVPQSCVLLGPDEELHATSFTVLREVGLDWQGQTCTVSVKVRLALRTDNQTLAVTASASPRRAQEY